MEYDEDVTHEISHAKWLKWYLGQDEPEKALHELEKDLREIEMEHMRQEIGRSGW